MKFMKLGSRPDTFVTTEAIRNKPVILPSCCYSNGFRSITSEVSTDIKIQVHKSLYQLHKFPLLSKCGLLQALCAGSKDSAQPTTIHLPDIPGGAEAFELCAKFCYGITITVSPLNFVPLCCAAEYLQMSDVVDRSNLTGKLNSFFKSCILRRWKDALHTLKTTRQYPPLCEELGITSGCVAALAAAVLANPARPGWPQAASKGWWAEDLAELGIDHYWRIMLAIKSAGFITDKIIGEVLQVYASRWLPSMVQDGCQSPPLPVAAAAKADSLREITFKQRLLVEKLVSLLPTEKGSVSCSFMLKLLKAANILNASPTSKLELVRRAAVQLEDATVNDLLIPSLSYADETLYDVDVVMTILEEFMLQGPSPPTSPPRGKPGGDERRRSRSAENVDFEGQECSRRSSSAAHSSKLKVAKIIDLYLLEIARDANLPVEKVIAIAEAVPDFARIDHDDLYRVVDTYLRAHPELDKNERKRLCRILDCKRLSVEACMHAAQNDQLPLRVVVQVLFFEQARAAMTGGQVSELPGSIRALLAKTASLDEEKGGIKCLNMGREALDEEWRAASDLKCPTKTKMETLRMKLAEDDHDIDEEVMHRDGLMRSSSSRFRALRSIPSKPRMILSKFWSTNRSVSERR